MVKGLENLILQVWLHSTNPQGQLLSHCGRSLVRGLEGLRSGAQIWSQGVQELTVLTLAWATSLLVSTKRTSRV